jgi:Uma2 family endonuclease
VPVARAAGGRQNTNASHADSKILRTKPAIVGTDVSVEEYLRITDKPNCEYVDGTLIQKAWPLRNHAHTQGTIAILLDQRFPAYDSFIELTVQISPTHYRVPDIVVDYRGHGEDPYPTSPVHLCIEILSEEELPSEVLEKCETYHVWGTPHTWVIDPQTRKAWQYSKGSAAVEIDPQGELTAGEIHIRLSEIFSVL